MLPRRPSSLTRAPAPSRRWVACGGFTAVLALGCTCLTEPSSEKTPSGQGANAEVRRTPLEKVAEPKRLARPAGQELITASHILVSYAGATRSQATRTKEEARTLAEQLLARVRKGEDFGELALAHSDDPTAKANRGNLGPSPASSWVKPFGDAAVALRAGEVSDLVETPFGIHIIKRDK